MPVLEIKLELIDDNPYQDRGSYEDIAELGRSIALNGLEQYPKARQTSKRFQLKFGHRRKRAFEWLQDNWKKEGLTDRYSGYTVMPLDVEDFSENEMFDGVVIENVHRDDLKVTEKARLLRRYKNMYPNATSEQIGLVFNMNAATVRGMDIFLDLPDEIQAALDSGQISQSSARLFHSMMKIAPKEKVLSTLKDVIKKDGDRLPEDVIEQHINNLNNTVRLWWGDGKPKAGHSGWDLDMKKFPNQLLPAMTVQQVGAYETQLDHLTNPPACTACPFYTKVRGTHFCGLRICYDRKTAAYQQYAVEQSSQRTKIKIYSKDDGSYRPLVSYESAHAKLFESRHEGLRLISKQEFNNYVYQSFKGLNDDHVVVVATGSLLEKLTSTSRGRTVGKKTEKEKAEMRAMKVYRIKRLELMWEYTAVAQTIFESTPVDVLNEINKWNHIGVDDRIPEEYNHPFTGDAAQKLTFQRRALVWRLIMHKTSHYSRSGLVDALNKFADVTSVKASKTLVKRAEEWDAQIKAAAFVSTATAKGKSK